MSKKESNSGRLMQLITILSLLISNEIYESSKKAHKRQKFPAILYHNLISAYFMLEKFDTIRLIYLYDGYPDRTINLIELARF